ncbi:hypothetical protein GC207_05640 [bacterium]|nr:hypothetical protein [bacterium]
MAGPVSQAKMRTLVLLLAMGTLASQILSAAPVLDVGPAVTSIVQQRLYGYVVENGYLLHCTFHVSNRSDRALSGMLDVHAGDQPSRHFELEELDDSHWQLRHSRFPSQTVGDYDLRVVDSIRGPALMGEHESFYELDKGSVIFIWLDPSVTRHPKELEDGLPDCQVKVNEDVSVSVYTSENGLVNNSTRDIAWAGNFMWVATVGGLSRFDGLNWKTYNKTSNPALPVENVSDLDVDPQGRLILATRGAGVLRLEYGRFVPVPGNERLPDRDILRVHAAADGSIWTIPRKADRIYRLMPTAEVATYSAGDLEIPDAEVWHDVVTLGSVFSFSDRVVLINSNFGPRLFDPETGHVTHLGLRWRWEALPDQSGAFVMRTFGGKFVRLRPDRNEEPLFRITRDGLSTGPGNIFKSDDGALWLADGKQFHRYDNGVLETFPQVTQALNSEIGTIAFGPEGGIWLQSGSGGVAVLRRTNSLHYTWSRINHGDPLGINPGTKTIRHESENNFSLSRLNDTNDTFENWDLGVTNRTILSLPNLMTSETMDYSRDGSGDRWYGVAYSIGHFTEMDTNQPQPILLRESGGLQTYYRQEDFPWGVKQVHSVAWRRAGEVWLATERGVFQWKDEKLHYWNREQALPEFEALCALVDSRGQVWIGTDGFGVLRVTNYEVRRFTQGQDGLSSDIVYSIAETRSGSIWLGGGNGVTRVRGELCQAFQLEQPFQDLAVRMVIEDNEENLWFGTFSGILCTRSETLSHLDGRVPDGLSVLRFSRVDGIHNEAIYTDYFPTAAKASNGDLLFCMEGGLIRFDPRAMLKTVSLGPPVRITGCSSIGTNYFDADLPPPSRRQHPLILPPDAQDFLELSFAATAFKEAHKTLFQYRLLGQSEEWSALHDQRSSRYARLAPGSYEFQVRAFDYHHVPSPKQAALAFSIAPFYYQTWWFRGGVVSAILGLATGFHRYRVRTRDRIKELEKTLELDAERSRIARDMHDEIGSSLAQIRIMGELASEDLGDSAGAQKIKQLAERAHKSSGSLREIIWSLNPDKQTARDLKEYMEKLADEFFEGTGIHPVVRGDQLHNAVLASPEVKRELVLIVKGIMSNVLKHSNAKRFQLEFAVTDGVLKIMARDDGVGFDPQNVSVDSLGLQALHERAQNLGGHFELKSSRGTGTTAVVEIPLRIKP